jgi:hypothetical protein
MITSHTSGCNGGRMVKRGKQKNLRGNPAPVPFGPTRILHEVACSLMQVLQKLTGAMQVRRRHLLAYPDVSWQWKKNIWKRNGKAVGKTSEDRSVNRGTARLILKTNI